MSGGVTARPEKQLYAALLDAFPKSGEMALVVLYAEFKRPFSDFLAAPGTPYETALLDLLEWVEAQNRVEDLLRAAREKNEGNPELRVVFKELMGPIERELVDLEPLLTPLEALTASKWSLYDKIAKPGWERRARKGDSIVKMARDLARMPVREEQGRRIVPLLAFVEGLCKQIADASELDSWLGRTKSALGVISGAGATLVGGEASGAGGYILVQVRPLPKTEEASSPEPSYGVKAWLLGTDRDKALLGKGPSGEPADTERTIRDVTADLPNLLNECIDALRDIGVSLDLIRFEFVVPRPLLHCEFDRMRVGLPPYGSISLGLRTR